MWDKGQPSALPAVLPQTNSSQVCKSRKINPKFSKLENPRFRHCDEWQTYLFSLKAISK